MNLRSIDRLNIRFLGPVLAAKNDDENHLNCDRTKGLRSCAVILRIFHSRGKIFLADAVHTRGKGVQCLRSGQISEFYGTLVTSSERILICLLKTAHLRTMV